MATTTTQQPPAAAPALVTPAIPGAPVAPNLAPPARPQVSASLYVGDLDPEIGESALYDLFKEIGNVASIRVCRDALSRMSLGYAYVNFHNSESAERAISVLNGTVLNKRPCRIMWSRRDPSIRKSGVGNIFIKNLNPNIDHAALLDLFSVFGNIHSCKLVTSKNGTSKGYGFVHFHTKESADQAIKKMNSLKFNGKEVYVAPFIPRRERPQKNLEDIYTNVFIKNIDESVTPEEFSDYFGQFGKITSAKLMMNEETGKTKGFGFANYSTHEEAVACVKETNNKEFHGKELYSARAQSRAERNEQIKRRREEQASKYQGVNLYIKNIDDSVSEDKLRKSFEEFGQITSVKIMTSEKGQSKGFGFVCFSKPSEATKALTNMNNAMLENKPLYVALAQRKEQRRAQLEAHHAQRNSMARMQPGQIGLTPPMGYPPVFYNPQVQSQGRGFIAAGYPQIPNQYRAGRPYPTNQIPAQQNIGYSASPNQNIRRQGGTGNHPRASNNPRGNNQTRPNQPGNYNNARKNNQPSPNNSNPNAAKPPSPAPQGDEASDHSSASVYQQLEEQLGNKVPGNVLPQVVEHLVQNENVQELLQNPENLEAKATQYIESLFEGSQ